MEITEDLKKLSEGDLVPKRTLEGMAGKLLLAISFILNAFGILAVYTSSAAWGEKYFHQSAEFFLIKQSVFFFIGVSLMFMIGKSDYRNLQKYSPVIFGISTICLGILLVLKVLGVISGSAARWVVIGPFQLQISEFSKYAMIIFVASYAAKNKFFLQDLYKGYLPLLIGVSSTVILIALEPNFSTASIIFLIGIIMMFIVGVRFKHLFWTGVGFLIFGGVYLVQAPYRVKRILSYIGMGSSETNHQIDQALLGLGSGGIFGVGLGHSHAREFLPLSYNDFIFAIIGEEGGFFIAAIIIFLYFLFLICGISLANQTESDFGKVLTLGITISICVYALMNMGVACGFLPTTGVVLPFISYGGSAMIANWMGIGLLMSISRKRKEGNLMEQTSEDTPISQPPFPTPSEVTHQNNYEKDRANNTKQNVGKIDEKDAEEIE